MDIFSTAKTRKSKSECTRLNRPKRINSLFFIFTVVLAAGTQVLAAAVPTSSQELGSLPDRLIRFQFAKNWSDTMHLLGIDMLTDSFRDILEPMIRSGDGSSAFPRDSIPRSAKGSLQLKKVKEVIVRKSISNHSFFSSRSAPCLFGWEIHRDEAGRTAQTPFIHDLEHDRLFASAAATKYMCLVDCGGQIGAVNPEHASSFFFLDADLNVSREVKCPESMFVRKIWSLGNDRFLVFHFPFATGTLFSIVHGRGVVLEQFYPASASPGISLREYFLDNFHMADYRARKIYLAKVYPEDELLKVEIIDLKTRTIRSMTAAIDDFSGQKAKFKKLSAVSLGKAAIAAVNGVFAANDGGVYVSLSVNNSTRRGQSFKHYLYRFDDRGAFTKKTEVPFGCVLYYERDKATFVSQKDISDDAAEQTEFMLFSLK